MVLSQLPYKLDAVRRACGAAHFLVKARLSGQVFEGSAAMSILFVGMMPRTTRSISICRRERPRLTLFIK